MFCSKCGSEVKEGQEFCPSCGNSLNPNPNVAENDTTNDASEEVVNETLEEVTNEAQDEVTNETQEEVVNETPDVEQNPTQDFTQNEASGVNPGFVPNQPFNMAPENQKKAFNKKLLIPIIGGAVALIVIIAIIVSCSKGGAEAKIDKYFDSLKDSDVDEYIEATMHDKGVEFVKEEAFDGDEEKTEKFFKLGMDEAEEKITDDYDFDLDGDYSVEKVGSLTKEAIEEQNDSGEEKVSDKFGDKYKYEVTDGALYKVKQKGADTFYIKLRKVDDKWCVGEAIGYFDDEDYKKE